MKRLSLPYYVTRSGAGFESAESFIKSSTRVDTNTDDYKVSGIPIAQIDRDTYATSSEELHCFVIGETGCGKTRRVIMPSVRLLARTGESMVISDPKGEIYKKTAYYLEKRGYDVKVLNFRNPRNGNRWNPLALVESLYKSGTLEGRDKAGLLMDDLISILSTTVEDKEDKYWGVSASSYFRGIIQIILEYGEDGDLTFENISLASREIYKAYHMRKISDSTVKNFISGLPNDSPIIQNLDCVINNADTTAGSIVSVMEGMISYYCRQTLLMVLFAVSEIDIASIGKKPTALFFILPDDSDALYPVATYFVKQVYSTLVNLADEQQNGVLPNKVTFLLDEFANFTMLPTMHAMLTAARSRGIRFVLVCQSMDQLSQKYKQEGMEILLSNCRVWLYMSCRNLTFLDRLVNLAGEYISPHTGDRFPLITLDTLQHFKMGQVLVFNDRCRPLIGYLDDYSNYDFGEEGNGVEVELPPAHATIERKLFSWESAQKKFDENTITEEQKEGPDTLTFSFLSGLAENPADDIKRKEEVADCITEMQNVNRLIQERGYILALEKLKSIDTDVYKKSFSVWHLSWRLFPDAESALMLYISYMQNAIPEEIAAGITKEDRDRWIADCFSEDNFREFLKREDVVAWFKELEEKNHPDETEDDE